METIEYINPKVDRSNWPQGEWDGEPDKKQWQDKETGLPCLAVRHPRSGHWCGYVGVSINHPDFGKQYDDVDVDVHWGLTFADKCQEVKDESGGICHKDPSNDNVWWFGFDCAHCDDVAPYEMFPRSGTYKTLGFVEGECERLAQQLKARTV